MSSPFTSLVAMPIVWIIALAIVVATVTFSHFLNNRPSLIIGDLAMRSWKRPNARDWARLTARVSGTENQLKLRAQIEDINQRFGENTVRCGHLAVWWYMALGEHQWEGGLPSFAEEGDFKRWLESDKKMVAGEAQ